MTPSAVTIAVPTADLRRAFGFFKDGLGWTLAVDAPDGTIPEPVQFALRPGTNLMVVPADGFRFVIGDSAVAPAGVTECVIGLTVDDDAALADVVARARAAGATIVAEPARRPWGTTAAFRDLDGHTFLISLPPPTDPPASDR